MQTENYKRRALDVRRSARANLQEIRQARMARKSAIHGQVAQSAIEKPQPSWEEENLPTAPTADDQVADLPVDALPEEGSADAAQSVLEQQDADSLDALAERNASLEDGVAGGNADLQATAEGSEATHPVDLDDTQEVLEDPPALSGDASAPEFRPAEISDWTQSELAQLPGAGPGLVWMLQQCGVDTLSELASRDAVALAQQLGVVGQIIDVGQWIAFAQEQG